MIIKEVPNSSGIVVILPKVEALALLQYIRKENWIRKRWNNYHKATRQYKSDEDLIKEFQDSKKHSSL